MERKAQAATETGVYIAIVAAILVVVNIIAFVGVHKRFDLTRNERYTLTQGSGRLIRSLKGPVHVDAYVTKGLPKLDAFVRDLTDLLNLYQQKGGPNFEYTIIEAKSDEQRAAAKEAGLQDMAFGEGSETGEDQATITQGYMGLVFKYGSEKDNIPAVSPDRADGLEFWITNKVRTIRDKADSITHKIGIITGKDELKLSDAHLIPPQGRQGGPSMRTIIERNFPFYKFEDVDLKSGDTEISKDLDGLIITQPEKDYTDKELRRIDQFMMLGNKALAVFVSAVNVKVGDGAMKGTLSTHGLEKLFGGYGIEMKKDAIFDVASSMQFPMITQTGVPVWFRYPSILQVHHDSRWSDDQQMLDDSFPVFFRSRELVFPYASTLVSHAEKQPEAKLKVLARTSDRASVETTDSVELKPSSTWKPKPPVSQKALAISVEGTLKAAMGPGDDVDVPAASKDKSRVLVVSSSQFLTNPFARAGAGQEMGGQFGMMGPIGGDEQLQAIAEPYAQRFLNPAIVCLKNALDWLSGDSDLIAASAKIFGDPNLTYADIVQPKIEASDTDESLKKKEQSFRDARKNAQRNIQITLSLLCPALFAGFGIYRWRRREGRRGAITLD
jgi:ABC-type uncharacterized transport system involved in gliding motility auxiliary subunit